MYFCRYVFYPSGIVLEKNWKWPLNVTMKAMCGNPVYRIKISFYKTIKPLLHSCVLYVECKLNSLAVEFIVYQEIM